MFFFTVNKELHLSREVVVLDDRFNIDKILLPLSLLKCTKVVPEHHLSNSSVYLKWK